MELQNEDARENSAGQNDAENKPESKMTFEKSMNRLEEVIRELESGNSELDRSMELYREGAALIASCGKMLDNAEQKIKILVQNQDGRYDAEDFSADTPAR